GPLVPYLEPIGEQFEDVALVDRRRREDSCARRMARDFADSEPFAPSEGGGRIEPEASTANGLPILAARVAAARDPIGEGEGESFAKLLVGYGFIAPSNLPPPILSH